MKYHCGHTGCDICGARECAGTHLEKYGEYLVCGYCILSAIKFAIHASETFSTTIDHDKPCGQKELGK